MGADRRARPRVLVEPLLAAILWGGVFAAGKIGMREIPLASFTSLRVLLAATLLLIAAGGVGWLRGRPELWRPLIVAGLAQAAFQVSLQQGIQHTTASLSAILLATAPLLSALWFAARGVERLSSRQWLGLGLGLSGVGLLVGADGVAGGGTLGGNLVAFAAAVAWAWYGVAIAPVAHAIGPVRAAAGTVALAALLLTPPSLGELAGVPWGEVSPAAFGGLLYGAVLGLFLATVLWVRSVQRWGTQATMNYGYLEPVAAVVIAGLVLGEVLRPIQGAGALLALVGVYLASTSPATRQPRQ